MTRYDIIEGLLDTKKHLENTLRKLLYEGIREAVAAITGGKDRLILQEFHQEDGVGATTYVLVEVDRHCGDQGCELVDSITLGSKTEAGFSVDTENGYQDGLHMSTSELTDLYLELHFIEGAKDDPEWEFTVKGDMIVLKEEE